MLIFNKEEGYTLIIVLWSIVILTLIFSYLLDDFFLENFLVENYARQQEIKETALSAYNIGLNFLLNDETLYDAGSDPWVKGVKGEIDGFKYTVSIKDIGSRINLNYDDPEIIERIDDWEGDLAKIYEYLEEGLMADLLFLKELLDVEDYQALRDYTTTYGNYNINQDSPRRINKILKFLDLTYVQNSVLAEGLAKLREEGQVIKDLDELPLLVEGLGVFLYEEIKPFLSTEGRININLVDEEILEAIFLHYQLDRGLLDIILSYREENEIKNLEDLNVLIDDEKFAEISGMFTTGSTFLEISVHVETEEMIGYFISSVVKRVYQDGKWRIEVLTWSENELFPRVIDDGVEKV